MSLFKKPKKNLSLKSARTTDDDVELDPPPTEPVRDEPIVVKPVEAVAEKLPSAKITAVSFPEENEEDGTEFQIKKSDRSIRVAKQLKQEYMKSQKIETNLSKPLTVTTKSKSKQSKGQTENDGDVILIGDDAAEFDDTSKSAETQPTSLSSSLSDMMKGGVIPDAKLIHLIRKKRQLMRDTGIATGEPTVGNVGVPVKIEPKREDKSALVREDDEADRSDISDQEGNDDADDGRLKMSVRQRQEDQRQKLRSTFLSAEQGSDPESDHELEWEKQQIIKGVSTINASERGQAFSSVQEPQKSKSNRVGGFIQPQNMAPPAKVSVSEIRGELSKHLSDLVESNRRHKFERQAREDSYEYSQEEIKRAEQETAQLDVRYRFYQELMAYVSDYIDCYNTKLPTIIAMEERLLAAYAQRSDRLMKRRRQDVVDQSLESAPLKAGQAAFQPDDDTRSRIAERNNRRSRRRWKRQEKGIKNHNEGWSTDDEEAISESVKITNEKENIRVQLNETISEISDDFVMLDSVTSRFEDWRNEAPDSYRSAFGGLCLAKLVAPIVRLQLLEWNPLEANCNRIHEHGWFKSLAKYCRVAEDEGDSPPADELSIIPSVVDKVVMVKLTSFVSSVWDPLSLEETNRLVNLISSLASTFPTLNADSKESRELVQAIKKRYNQVLDNDIFMPLCSKQGLAERSSPLASFFYRQMWTCVKLFVSMSKFSEIMSCDASQDIMLTGLLNRYISLGLTQLDGVSQEIVDIYSTIMSAVPVVWFSKMPPSQTTTIDKLKPFATLLFQLVARFSSSAADSATRGAVKMFASGVSDFFTVIHAYDLASRIVSELKIQLS